MKQGPTAPSASHWGPFPSSAIARATKIAGIVPIAAIHTKCAKGTNYTICTICTSCTICTISKPIGRLLAHACLAPVVRAIPKPRVTLA